MSQKDIVYYLNSMKLIIAKDLYSTKNIIEKSQKEINELILKGMQ
jgi:hypothetical protein